MLNISKLITFIAILSTITSCSNLSESNNIENKAPDKEVKKQKEDFQDIEVVFIGDFNKRPPFFSTLTESSIEWKTTTQVNNTEKTFQFKASTIFAVNDEIIKSNIVDDQVIINHGIHTGMSRLLFEAHFNRLEANENPHGETPIIRLSDEEVYISCCTEETQYWKFSFDKDTLYQISYYQYYD